MVTFIRKYPIWAFLIINYAISWGFLFPSYRIIQENDGITPLALIGLIGAYGPTIAAIIVQGVLDKKKLKTMLGRLLRVRVSCRIYLFVIIAPILFYVVAYLLGTMVLDGNLHISWMAGLSGIPIWFLAALPFGPMGEELGWRGFMLPRLLDQFSILKASFFVGLAWGVWHLASFSFPGAAIPEFLSVNVWTIFLYFANTIALSIVFSYVYLKSRGSVFMAILLHTFFNAASNITFDFFAETQNVALLTTTYILNLVLAGTVGVLLVKKAEKRGLKKII